MKSHLTDCGIPGIGVVPYGIHMCHFYSNRQDLIDGLMPYFLAGLRHNERCLWVGSTPLPAVEIRREVARSPEIVAAVESEQLRILDAVEWYGEPSSFKAEEVIQGWIDEEERALVDGYEGLRVTGNTSFVPRDCWSDFMKYEELLGERLQGRRIVTCCSYDRHKCGPVDVFEVVQRHDAALDRFDGHWYIFLHDTLRARTTPA